ARRARRRRRLFGRRRIARDRRRRRGVSGGAEGPRACRRKRVRRCALLGLVALAACPGTRGAGPRLGGGVEEGGTGTPEVKAVEIVRDERTIEVPLANDAKAELGALLVHPKDGKGPAILIVPGASDVSRKGTRAGDGVTRYAEPVDVYLAWADAFAKRGANVLLWD